MTEVFSFITATSGMTLGLLPLGDEVRAQGGSGILCMEAEELPPAQAVAAPRPEHPAHDGPGRTVHTEGGLSGRCGRQGGG